MNRKVNYLIIMIILIAISLISLSTYLDIQHEKKAFQAYLDKFYSSTKQSYKKILQESVESTIVFIDSAHSRLLENHKRLLQNEQRNIVKHLKNLTPQERYDYMNEYQHDYIKISNSFVKKSVQESIKVNNEHFYIWVKEDHLKKTLLSIVKEFIYANTKEDKRYIWINQIINYEGGENYAIRLVHPNLKNQEMSYLSTNMKDIKGNTPFLTELNGIVQNKEIFFEYYFKEINSSVISKKLSYAKLYKNFNWIIATGIPLSSLHEDIAIKTEEMESTFKQHFTKMIIFETLSISLFILLLLFMRLKLKSIFATNQQLKEKLSQKLEKTQENYRDLFYKNKTIILIVDPIDGAILDANEAASNFYKYSIEKLTSLNINNINTLDKKEIQEELLQAQKDKRNHFLFKHRISTGETIPVKVFSTPTEYNGNIALHSIIQNVKDEYQVKENLNETIHELKQIQQNLDDAQRLLHLGSWEFDVETNIIFCSKETTKIFEISRTNNTYGYDRLLKKVHPNDLSQLVKNYNESLHEKKPMFSKHRLLFDNNKIKFVEEKLEHIFDDAEKHVKTIGTIRDITEQTQLENQANRFFSLSINILLISNFEGEILRVNPGWERILGYTKEELLNKRFLDFVHPNDVEKTLSEMEKLSQGEMTFYFENRYRHKDGSYKTLAWSANSMIDNGLLYASAQDITEIKEKTNILFQQSKMASIGEMMANIAHQWRQPLSAISTLASGVLVQKEVGTLNDEILESSMNQISTSTKYLSNTIEDFRNFFNPNKTKVELSSNHLVEKTLKMLEAQFKNMDIEIIQQIEEITFITYENELLQVLINLLNNARDQLIKERQHQRLIFIDIYTKSNKLYISIKDNGGGIEDTIISKVFEPYFTTKDKSVGTGIGLYMSEEIIVKHMAGSISVCNDSYMYNNTNYSGAEFTISLSLKGNSNE